MSIVQANQHYEVDGHNYSLCKQPTHYKLFKTEGGHSTEWVTNVDLPLLLVLGFTRLQSNIFQCYKCDVWFLTSSGPTYRTCCLRTDGPLRLCLRFHVEQVECQMWSWAFSHAGILAHTSIQLFNLAFYPFPPTPNVCTSSLSSARRVSTMALSRCLRIRGVSTCWVLRGVRSWKSQRTVRNSPQIIIPEVSFTPPSSTCSRTTWALTA